MRRSSTSHRAGDIDDGHELAGTGSSWWLDSLRADELGSAAKLAAWVIGSWNWS